MDSVILITEDKDKWNGVFHEKLIFSKLTDDHVLRLLTLQKIRKHNKIDSKLIIYLDNLDLDEFGLHPKLYTILNNCSSLYNVKILDTSDGINNCVIDVYNKKVEIYNDKDNEQDKDDKCNKKNTDTIVNEQVEISI
jgi:hypothetical protein